MPYEDSLIRQKLGERARRARHTGEIAEVQFPISSGDTGGVTPRDSAVFDDLTGKSIIGFGTIGAMTT